MIADWDLWPWIIAASAGETELYIRRIEANVRQMQRQLMLPIYPLLRTIRSVIEAGA